MADKTPKRGLGRGFDSLIPTQIVETEFDVTARIDPVGQRLADMLREVEPGLIDPNPHQPRQVFDDRTLQEMAGSIREHGILQPLVVTVKDDGRYELIAGERRLRASVIVGLVAVPVIVRSFGEQQKLELALIENLQRANLNAIETATAYRKLMDQFNLSHEQVGQRVSKDRSTVANTLRLLNLPLEAKRAINDGTLSEGHARVILSVEEPEKQLQLLELIIKNGWSVREAEEFARAFKGGTGTKEKAHARISATSQVTKGLSEYLGTKVTQIGTAKGGKLMIEFYSDEDLDRIYRAIKQG